MNGYAAGNLNMLFASGPVVKAVILALVFFSLLSWAIAFNKWKELRRLEAQGEDFLETIKKSEALERVTGLYDKQKQGPYAALLNASLREAQLRKKDDRSLSVTSVLAIESVLRATTMEQAGRFGKKLSFLATTANTAPFIGLFGTVWGIMESFRDIGITGNTSLAVVAPGISEALITTALGLATAIPAVLAYNYLMGRLKGVTETMESASVHIMNHLTR